MFKRKHSENAFVLVLFLTGIHLLYAKTVQAGFVTDFTGLQQRLDGAPFTGFLTCFGFPALHQVTNFFLYLFYKCFHTNGLPWYLVFTSLHVANGFLGFELGKKIFSKAGVGRAFLPALMGSLLFLFSPYQAEAVIWKVCFNFLFCTFTMLCSLLFLVKYLDGGRSGPLIWSHLFFVLALFTFELALSLPMLALALLAWWPRTPQTDVWKNAMRVSVPHLLLAGLYFVLNKCLLGTWVGHYGEGVHLNFDLKAIAANLLKYFLKNLLYWRDLPHPVKEQLIQTCEQPMVAYGFLSIGMAALAGGIVFFKKLAPAIKSSWLFGLLFFLALLPVSNLFVAYLLHGENDRYGYFASLFFYMALTALLLCLPTVLRYGLFATVLLISLFYLHRMTVFWKNGAQVYNSLLEDFRWEEAPEVYVLAFPENYQGIQLFRDYSKQEIALKHALKYQAGKDVKGRLYQIAQFNMTSTEDGVAVGRDAEGAFIVQFKQWGNWWWLHGLGLGDYETEQYQFSPIERGSNIELKKTPPPGAVFIYSDGGGWREVE